MRRFWSDVKGNVAILFALATIPVIGAMGAAVDYSLANAHRTDMQKALDSTALALTKLMPTSQANLDEKGLAFFKASLGANNAYSNLQLSIVPSNGILKLDATAQYAPKLAGIMGINTFPIGAHSETKWGIGKVEVALALDNTGSMSSSGKMTQLKAAAKNLLTILQNSAQQPGDAKVAIIPFDTTVNVGTAYKNASWLRWDELDCNGWWQSGSGCGSNPQDQWEGCVADRDQSNDVNDTTPSSSTSTKFPAVQCGSLVTLMPLSTDWTALASKIDSMQPNGNTNVTIGLIWAWHLLSPGVPFSDGAGYGSPNLTKVIILLTDGDNTENRWTSSESSINARTSAACTNIKAAGITIYTVRVINGNASLLSGCASDSSKYFNVQDASQLTPVFNAIGGQIANLHLAK